MNNDPVEKKKVRRTNNVIDNFSLNKVTAAIFFDTQRVTESNSQYWTINQRLLYPYAHWREAEKREKEIEYIGISRKEFSTLQQRQGYGCNRQDERADITGRLRESELRGIDVAGLVQGESRYDVGRRDRIL